MIKTVVAMASSSCPYLGLALCRVRPSPSLTCTRTSTSTSRPLPRSMATNILLQTSPFSTTLRTSTLESATPPPPPPQDRPVFDPHFLVVSLGNPPPHGEGLHSAGHHALIALQKHLHCEHNQPPFSSERIAKKASRVSRGPKYSLFQCPTLMNVSGPWVSKAWKELLTETAHTRIPLGLVIVHDDLEQDMCLVKTRDWNTSHRGHNGLKSIMATLRSADYTDSKWAKIRVGIGRPEGRDHDTVSNYVLKPMSSHQKAQLAQSGGPVLAALKEIEQAWVFEVGNGTEHEGPKATKQAKKGKRRPQPDSNPTG